MIARMKHEPFYTSGTSFLPEIGVYGGWVAHEDSFAASQSTHVNLGGVSLLFSGEFFSPLSLPTKQPSIENKENDRNVDQLLHLYDKQGDHFVEQMNGLFSGLLIDQKRNRTLLFNDRYGAERIYYYEKNDITYFASEAKALLAVIPELRAFDDEGVAQFLAFGCTLGETTLFKKIKMLPGGSIWNFEEGTSSRKTQYFLPKDWESQDVLTEEAFEIELLETFERILPQYVSSLESKIGISLTGGLDTRMIMAGVSKELVEAVCYTFAGLEGETLDVKLARSVADMCQFDHHILRIGTDFLSNYGTYVDKTVFYTDGCAGAMGAHEIYFNAQARKFSPIRLTGNFGSEILRSMSTFKPLNLTRSLINKDISNLVYTTVQNVIDKKTHPVTFAAFQEIPWNLFGAMAAGKSQLTFRTPYLDNEIVRLAFRAPSSSRQSPQSALRLVNNLNPGLAKIPTDLGLLYGDPAPLSMLRQIFSKVTFKLDYLHKEGLPNWLSPVDPLIGSLSKIGILGLHKFLPYRNWYRQEMASYIGAVLTDAQTQRSPYWNASFLTSILEDHISGRKNYTREIHSILTLEAIERLIIRNSSESE
ncbi:MAG: asparagine synthase-related protein [Thiotrichaceae bacterium]